MFYGLSSRLPSAFSRLLDDAFLVSEGPDVAFLQSTQNLLPITNVTWSINDLILLYLDRWVFNDMQSAVDGLITVEFSTYWKKPQQVHVCTILIAP